MGASLHIPPKRIAMVLGGIASSFAALTVMGAAVENSLGDGVPGPLHQIITILSAGGERNAPTWFAVVMLLMCGLTLALIAYFKWLRRERYRTHWIGLSVLFIAMSAEEIVGLHERLNGPFRRLLGETSWFYYSWVIAGIVAVGLFALVYFRFWRHLDTRTRWLFAVAAILYIAGSIGFEMLGANILITRGGPTLRFWLYVALEELGEMLGATVFLYALLSYVARYLPEIEIQVMDRLDSSLPLSAGDSSTG